MSSLRSLALCVCLASGSAVHAQGLAAPTVPFVAPPELQRPLTFLWSGSLDDAVRSLAGQIGYGFDAATFDNGPLPDAAPVIGVSINAINQPLAAIIGQLGRQAGEQAVILIDPDKRTLQVFHHVP